MKVHSTVLGTRLEQMSQVLYNYGWATGQRICLQLLAEKPELSECVSITRSSLRCQMFRKKIQISFVQIMTGFT